MTEMVPRSGGGESTSTVIKLDTVRKIAEKVTVRAQINKQEDKGASLFLPCFFSFGFSLYLGQAPSAGHHSHCSREAELHPVPSNGVVLGPTQPERRQGHEAEIQP